MKRLALVLAALAGASGAAPAFADDLSIEVHGRGHGRHGGVRVDAGLVIADGRRAEPRHAPAPVAPPVPAFGQRLWVPPHRALASETVCDPAVYDERLVPVFESRRVPVHETVEVPVFRVVQVPVYEDRVVPVYGSVWQPSRSVLVGPHGGVSGAHGGRERLVQVGTRVERVQVGTRLERVQTGTRAERVQVGERVERVQVGTRVERVLVRPEICREVTRLVEVPGRWVVVVDDPRRAGGPGDDLWTWREYAEALREIRQGGVALR
jgi:hypothetical protein